MRARLECGKQPSTVQSTAGRRPRAQLRKPRLRRIGLAGGKMTHAFANEDRTRVNFTTAAL
jgi:hypothetical protein